jgi:hypothetical protein
MIEFMDGEREGADYPFVQRLGDVALIGVSTAIPSLPLVAVGRVGDEQLARLDRMLAQTRRGGAGAGGADPPSGARRRRQAPPRAARPRGLRPGHRAPWGRADPARPRAPPHRRPTPRAAHRPVPVHGVGSGTYLSQEPDRHGAFSVYTVAPGSIRRVYHWWNGVDVPRRCGGGVLKAVRRDRRDWTGAMGARASGSCKRARVDGGAEQLAAQVAHEVVRAADDELAAERAGAPRSRGEGRRIVGAAEAAARWRPSSGWPPGRSISTAARPSSASAASIAGASLSARQPKAIALPCPAVARRCPTSAVTPCGLWATSKITAPPPSCVPLGPAGPAARPRDRPR